MSIYVLMSVEFNNIDKDFLEKVSDKFRLLSHQLRLRILGILEEGPLSVSDIQMELEIPQAVVSQHLIAMKNYGILGYDRQGSRHIYYIEDRNVCGILRCIEKAHAARDTE